MTIEAEQLKPCPFCEGKARLGHVSRLRQGICTECEAAGPLGVNEAEAIAAWNHRPTLTADDDVLEVVNALDDVQQAEAEYRLMHDRHGDGSQATGARGT